MSGYSDKEYLKAAIQLKAINYIEKPFDPKEIEAELEHVSIYVELQNMRFQNTVDFVTDIPDELSGKRNGTAKGNNIAVYNIHKRLKLLFGEPYGLHYSSIPGEGTEVRIRIPAFPLEEVGPCYSKILVGK